MATEQTHDAPLSPKKKRALVDYLAILFAVAFLLVCISLVVKVIVMQNDLDAANRGVGESIQSLETSVDRLENENEALRLLSLAQEALRNADSEAFSDRMQQLSPYAGFLPEQSAAIYRELLHLQP